MIARAFHQPYEPERTRKVLYGRLVVRVASGEAPERIPHFLDVARRAASAPTHFDGGDVDRALSHHTSAFRVTRAYRSAARVGAMAAGHVGWDPLEERLGLSRTFMIDVDPHASVLQIADALRDLGSIEQASPAYLDVTPFDEQPSAARPDELWYGQRMVGASEALRYEPGDSTLIVAIVDSGIDLEHPEFSGTLRPGADTVDLPRDRVARGVTLIGDSTRPDREPQDEMGHGTSCAGIIGARGLRIPHGLAGAARMLAMRVLAGARLAEHGTLTAIGVAPNIDCGVKLAIDLGARVLNLSFGTPESSLREDDPRPHEEVVAYARERGCILVAASGNSGDRTRYYPACLDGVIAVGAVGPEGRPSHFSTRGDHVDLCAPGEHIPSATIGGYHTNTGTSFAAPFVTAACALLAARAARLSRPLDGETARDVLKRTARPFPKGTDPAGCGAGILDVPAALRALEEELGSSESEDVARPRTARRPQHEPVPVH